MNSIVIADDHPLLLKGLKDFLLERSYNVVADATDGQSAYNQILKHRPAVAILDIEMPVLSGIEVARKCKQNHIDTKIVLITLHKDRTFFSKAKELNIFGYLLKDFALEEIESCLSSVFASEPYFSREIPELLQRDNGKGTKIERLTPSEKKILKLIADQKTTKEISELLFISERTVDKHRSNMIAKLGLDAKANSLLLWAREYFT